MDFKNIVTYIVIKCIVCLNLKNLFYMRYIIYSNSNLFELQKNYIIL